VITFSNFPAALAWFLVDAGYPYWNADAAAADPTRSPSFDCRKVRSVNLRLVCATPELSVADRALADAYERLMSVYSDPQQLLIEQRAWILSRNNGPPDIDILNTLYVERINALQGPPPT
jgi:uncharacterized protein